MKAIFPLFVMSALLLTACGGHGEKVYAVNSVDEAAAAAIAKAPAAEEVKFDDFGESTVGNVGGAAGFKPPEAAAPTITGAAEPTAATTTETAGEATTDNTATASADTKSAKASKTDTAPTAQPASAPEAPATEAPAANQ